MVQIFFVELLETFKELLQVLHTWTNEWDEVCTMLANPQTKAPCETMGIKHFIP